MKKTLVAAILGLATVSSVLAQGNISMDTYFSYGQLITYGAPNINGSSGGTVGEGVTGFTAGLMYVVGGATTANAVNASFNGSGYDLPTGNGLVLASGTGSTAPIGALGAGLFYVPDSFQVPGAQAADYTITAVVLAYNGADYATSTIRGHSAAFTMTAKLAGVPDAMGGVMPTFSVFNAVLVPEPSTFALAGLGLASLVIFRRRK